MVLYLRSDGIFDPHHGDAGQFVEDVILSVPVWLSSLSRKVPVGHTDGPQPIARHRLNHLSHHLVTVLGLEYTRLALGVQDTRASGRRERIRGSEGRL